MSLKNVKKSKWCKTSFEEYILTRILLLKFWQRQYVINYYHVISRYGSEGCGHFSCDYFLSYKVDSSTLLEIELSGRTKGWIAVGFSSDRSMVGGYCAYMGCK